MYRDIGLLVIRLGVGLNMIFFHGYGKISGGPESWQKIGGSMQNLGIGFAPTFWGFMAGFSEFFGSSLLVLGLLFRPAAALLAFTMLVASLRHLTLPPEEANAGWRGASHALELFSVYLGFLLVGPGRLAVTSLWSKRARSGESPPPPAS